MDFSKLAKSRFSVRKYSDKKIDKETLDAILETARFAPSACNKQPWSIYVATSDEVLGKLKQAYSRDWMNNVSTILVLTAHHDNAWHRDHYDAKDHSDVDLAILADHIILAATEKGLGSCWVCAFDPAKCREALQLTDANEEPVVMIPLGYKDESLVAPEKSRKAFTDVVIYK